MTQRADRPSSIDPEGEFPFAAADYVLHLLAAIHQFRDSALDALGMLGPVAKDAISALKSFADAATDASVREAVADVLRKIEARQMTNSLRFSRDKRSPGDARRDDSLPR